MAEIAPNAAPRRCCLGGKRDLCVGPTVPAMVQVLIGRTRPVHREDGPGGHTSAVTRPTEGRWFSPSATEAKICIVLKNT